MESHLHAAGCCFYVNIGGCPPPSASEETVPPELCATPLEVNGVVSVTRLLQYAMTRLYADKNGLIAEFPDWIGRDLFDLDDPLVSEPLPTISEENVDVLGALSGSRAPLARRPQSVGDTLVPPRLIMLRARPNSASFLSPVAG